MSHDYSVSIGRKRQLVSHSGGTALLLRDGGDVLTLLAPTVAFLQISALGQIYATELLLMVSLPFVLLANRKVLQARTVTITLLLGLFWLLSQIATDIVVGSDFVDFARGWARIGFFLANFVAILLLIGGKQRRIALFAVGIAIGGVLTFLFAPTEHASAHPWKFGYGMSVTIAVVVVAAFLWRRKGVGQAAVGLLVCAGILNFLEDFRSLAGFCLLTAAVCTLQRISGGMPRMLRSPVVLGLLMIAASAVTLEVYAAAASHGWLGPEAMDKYNRQASGALGVLLGGRNEILVSLRAIADSPFLGHGSWAEDIQYVAMRVQLLESLGYEVVGDPYQRELIPSHSHLFGAWVEGGLLGGAFFLWIFWIGACVFVESARRKAELSPLVVFLVLTMLWHLLFSPLGADMRYMTPFYAAVATTTLMALRSNLDAARRAA